MIRPLALLFCVLPIAASAFTLQLPENAEMRVNEQSPITSFSVATGPWTTDGVPLKTVEGKVQTQVYRIDSSRLTTLQILAPLREQLSSSGFDAIYECRTEECGGFDFRYGIELVGAPDMLVNLGDFRYISVQREDETLALMISRTATAGFIQITHISGSTTEAPDPVIETTAPAIVDIAPQVQPAEPLPFNEALNVEGRVILADLAFESGSSELGQGEFQSLGSVADYLSTFPERNVVLVGHTDSSGPFEGNMTLSLLRAESVRNRLVSEYGINPDQISADGAGPLAPLVSNLTPEGREQNRRVEAVLLSTQ